MSIDGDSTRCRDHPAYRPAEKRSTPGNSCRNWHESTSVGPRSVETCHHCHKSRRRGWSGHLATHGDPAAALVDAHPDLAITQELQERWEWLGDGGEPQPRVEGRIPRDVREGG